MNLFYKNKLFKKFRLKRRAVVRTIDFLVSFTLFIILLTQFYLVIINMNLNLATISTKQDNPAELFADKILKFPGNENWGTISGSPSIFGLASDYHRSSLGYYLDLAKLSRLNGELQYLPISSQYSYVTPQEVINNITGPNSNTQFRLTTRPPMQVLVSQSGGTNSTLTISTLTWSNISLSGVNVEAYYVPLNGGNSISGGSVITGSTGKATIITPIPANNYVAIVLAHAKANWGISCTPINLGVNSISASNISSYMLNNPNINTNSVLQSVNNSLPSGQTISISSSYVNATNNLIVNSTSYSITDSANEILTNVGSQGPLIQVYSISTPSGFDYYRVVTEPLIFDNVNYSTPSTTSYDTSQYPVYQSVNFLTADFSSIYTYSTMVMTERGPILLTLDLANS